MVFMFGMDADESRGLQGRKRSLEAWIGVGDIYTGMNFSLVYSPISHLDMTHLLFDVVLREYS